MSNSNSKLMLFLARCMSQSQPCHVSAEIFTINVNSSHIRENELHVSVSAMSCFCRNIYD